jgi:hypothetical protein
VALVIAIVSAVGGCGLPDDAPPKQQVKPDSGVAPETDSGGSRSPQMQKPAVDAVPNSICGDSVPLQGSAPAGSSVFVMGGLATSGIATDAHPTTGRFCLDVPLKKNSSNTLEVRAQDPKLGMSDAVTVVVTHSTCKDDAPVVPPEEQKSRNVALGIKGSSSKTPEEGNEGFLTDGKTSQSVVYTQDLWSWGGGDANIWVRIKLEKLTELEKIVVRWRDSNGSGSSYGGRYKVIVSPMSDPGDPNIKNGYWTEVGNITEGDGGTDSFDLKAQKPVVQQVALWLQKDGSTNWQESFAISELEVWDAPKKSTPTPTPQANTCANVGSGSP